MQNVVQRSLELLIDSEGLQSVLEQLGTVCFDKAEHIQTNWQDKSLASQWNKAGKAISVLASREVIERVCA